MQNQLRLINGELDIWLKTPYLNDDFIDECLLDRFRELMREDPVTLHTLLNRSRGMGVYSYFRDPGWGKLFEKELAQQVAFVRQRGSERKDKKQS